MYFHFYKYKVEINNLKVMHIILIRRLLKKSIKIILQIENDTLKQFF
jgi:hypothetical protein